MKIQLKFLGSLQYDLNKKNFAWKISSEKSIYEIVTELLRDPLFKELKIFFSDSLEVKRSLLILINEQEISALEGMATKVKANDTLVFIPVIHGGSLNIKKIHLL
jgi:molybdopterin converting factor small subunit